MNLEPCRHGAAAGVYCGPCAEAFFEALRTSIPRSVARELIVRALTGDYVSEHMWPHTLEQAGAIADRWIDETEAP